MLETETKEVVPSFSMSYELEYTVDPRTGKRQLTEECNKKILMLAKEGNFWAKEDFFRENFPLVVSVAASFANARIEMDDRIGYCQIGFCRAFDTYSTDNTASFGTYATHCMRNELIKHISFQKRARRKGELDNVSGDTPMGEDNGAETLLTLCGSEDRSYTDFERNVYLDDVLQTAFKRLKPRHQEIFKLYYLEDVSMSELSEMYGTKRQGIQRIITNSLQVVREVAKARSGGVPVF